MHDILIQNKVVHLQSIRYAGYTRRIVLTAARRD